MTVFYLDTEFNGHGGELISIALVSPAGEQFYGVCSLPEFTELDPWVRENVIPKLGLDKISHLRRLPYAVIRSEIQQFLYDFDNPEIICDWHKDAVHLLNLLEGPEYASSLDFACRITILKTPSWNGPVSKNPHNAVADATALMEWHQNESAKFARADDPRRQAVAQAPAYPSREVQD